MFTATNDLMLPATVTGSWPRPRWYTANMWGRPLDTAMMDPWFREQFTDAHALVVLAHRGLGHVGDVGPEALDVVVERPHGRHEPGRARGGGLVGAVRDVVGDAAVDLVTHAGEHRHAVGVPLVGFADIAR